MEICLQNDNIVYEKVASTRFHPVFFQLFPIRSARKKIRLHHEIGKSGLQSILQQ